MAMLALILLLTLLSLVTTKLLQQSHFISYQRIIACLIIFRVSQTNSAQPITILTSKYGGSGGTAQSALNQGRISGILDWGISTCCNGPQYAMYIHNWTSDGITTVLNWGNGDQDTAPCNPFNLTNNDYITGYKVYYGTSGLRLVRGLIFYTLNGYSYSCLAPNINNFGNDQVSYYSQIDDFSYLTGWKGGAGAVIDYIQLQFTAMTNLTNGLIAHFNFDDPAQFGLDSSGNGNSATNYGATGTVDRFNECCAMHFDGNDYLKVDSPNNFPALLNSERTITAWFKATNGGMVVSVGSAHANTPYNEQFAFHTNNMLYGGGNSNDFTFSSASSYSSAIWYHVVVTKEGNNAQLYINSIYIGSTAGHTYSTGLSNTQNILIGVWNDPNRYFNGDIDEVRIYNRALTQREIDAVYAFTPTPAPTENPTPLPTNAPTSLPTNNPTPVPTNNPTPAPTKNPTPTPTSNPTPAPTINPTPTPTNNPTPAPTKNPTPTPTSNPTPAPTINPTPTPTNNPTPAPTKNPTPTPTSNPTPAPTINPTPTPTKNPTSAPTQYPTPTPTANPTLAPTKNPTPAPTKYPTPAPTQNPTEAPTNNPTPAPTQYPTPTPTANPTLAPTKNPTPAPTKYPTPAPTQNPTEAPTNNPTPA
eukprot:546020_1